MLRFRPTPANRTTASRRESRVGSRQHWRVWMLLILLGFVVATMRQLNKPSTAGRLEQWLRTPAAATQPPASHPIIMSTAKVSDPTRRAAKSVETVAPRMRGDQTASSGDKTAALARVQDNTYFRPAESAAWFGLFNRLRQSDAEQLRDLTVGEVSYTQLLKQPQVYRGRVVTVRGTLRRQEIEYPAENSCGIQTYHRLVIQPGGGGHWPVIVYCLEWPSDFPRGDDLQASIEVTGYFFKNWSYAWQDGLAIAPVVLARNADWQPPVAERQRRLLTHRGLAKAFVVAGVVALLTVYWVVRSTRRPSRLSPPLPAMIFPDESTVETVAQRLQRLADTETHE